MVFHRKFKKYLVDVTSDDSETIKRHEFRVPPRYSRPRPLDKGGSGIVFLATDVETKKLIAIKKLSNRPFDHPYEARKAYREVLLLKNIRHKNIIKLLDIYTPNRSPETFEDLYLVMEYAEHNLCHTIHEERPQNRFTHEFISSVIYQLLSACQNLHQSGVIHRDIKPHNIALDNNGILKLLDFGLARNLTNCSMTRDVVTEWWRAPELSFSNNKYDAKVDIWSVVCIMGEMVKREVLFKGEEFQQWETITKIMGAPSEQFKQRLGAQSLANDFPVATPLDVLFPDCDFREENAHLSQHFTPNCARDFISKLLKIDPAERFSTEEALQHPYLEYHRQRSVNDPFSTYRYDPRIDTEQMDFRNLIYEETKTNISESSIALRLIDGTKNRGRKNREYWERKQGKRA